MAFAVIAATSSPKMLRCARIAARQWRVRNRQPSSTAGNAQQTTQSAASKVQQATNTADYTAQFDPKDIADHKGMAVLCYLSWLFLIPLLAEKDSALRAVSSQSGDHFVPCKPDFRPADLYLYRRHYRYYLLRADDYRYCQCLQRSGQGFADYRQIPPAEIMSKEKCVICDVKPHITHFLDYAFIQFWRWRRW